MNLIKGKQIFQVVLGNDIGKQATVLAALIHQLERLEPLVQYFA